MIEWDLIVLIMIVSAIGGLLRGGFLAILLIVALVSPSTVVTTMKSLETKIVKYHITLEEKYKYNNKKGE